jgi:hypothetical protein
VEDRAEGPIGNGEKKEEERGGEKRRGREEGEKRERRGREEGERNYPNNRSTIVSKRGGIAEDRTEGPIGNEHHDHGYDGQRVPSISYLVLHQIQNHLEERKVRKVVRKKGKKRGKQKEESNGEAGYHDHGYDGGFILGLAPNQKFLVL